MWVLVCFSGVRFGVDDLICFEMESVEEEPISIAGILAYGLADMIVPACPVTHVVILPQ